MFGPRIAYTLILTAFLGSNAGCAEFSSSAMKNDSWYTGIPQDVSDLAGWSQLESRRLHVVSGAKESRAQGALEANQLTEISVDQASEVLGYIPGNIPDTKFYLVRSVLLNEKTGGYYVSILNGYLWVHHASLGREPVKMQRRVLVLQLREMPKQVYVTCSIAE